MKNDIRHIAFVMDGNGRWAESRGKKRTDGHRAGVETLRKISQCCFEMGIKTVTVFAFSTENWKRSKDETDAIFSLINDYLKSALRDASKNKIKISFIGNLEPLDEKIKKTAAEAAAKTQGFCERSLVIALNYGGRDDIVRAVNKCVENGVAVSEQAFEKMLDTGDLDLPDLIVRTGGHKRMSNFLLFQAAYSELCFSDVLWPDFEKADLERILNEFEMRQRNFGAV